MVTAGPREFELRFGGVGRLYGGNALERLRRARVAVVGVGGVGSWSVEALARSGVGHLTLIDLDEVCVSNVNRQLPALTETIGLPKVRVLAERVREINPECEVCPTEQFFTAGTADRLLAPRFDCVLDAIDSVSNKALLVALCRERNMMVVTTGAAGGRRDATAVRVDDLALCTHDRLLQRLRKVLRARHSFPRDPQIAFGIPAIYSPETPVRPDLPPDICEAGPSSQSLRLNCESGYGTAAFVTGAFGFAAAGELVRRLIENAGK